ncbi:MAG: hypothetical protein U0744_03570 [Gemmataceae bacterium]
MRRIVLVCVFALAPTAAFAQTASPSKTPAEFRFADGSIVRMLLLNDVIEIRTKYGTLNVPVNDIRRIEFGMHMPDTVRQRIDQSIRLLGSDAYKQREDAGKDLVQAGHWAYAPLQKAAQSSDRELSQRAGAILKKLSESVSAEALKMKEDDTIHTLDFPIIGIVTNTTLKTSSPLFGEQQFKIGDIRSLHIHGGRGDAELSLDAARIGSTSEPWHDTGLTVDRHLKLIVTADGDCDLWPQTPGQYVAHPRGYNTPGKGGTYLAGALIGKIGENGRTFMVGDRYEGTPNEEGKLYLSIVASPWNNASSGSYRVRIRTDATALVGGK